MLVKTILNQCHKFKSFVYEGVTFEWVKGERAIVVDIVARKNGLARCSKCKAVCPVYDHLTKPRLFEFVPLWGIKVYFRYEMRRVTCGLCGIRVEAVPWVEGKSHLTKAYQLFLAGWAKRLSWQETARAFRTSWENVYRSVEKVVKYGLTHRSMEGITAIGVDEFQYSKGHQYITLVYQIEEGCRRLLYVGKTRTVKALLRFFRELGKEKSKQLKYVCSDMWKPYLKVIAKKAPNALHILDRFHIVQNLNKALNEIRAAEARRLKQAGYESVLKHTKYCFLKNKSNLTPKQKVRLKDVLRYDLKSVRAYLLKESFQLFWEYKSPYWAEWYLKKWCTRAMQSRLEPIKKFVGTIRNHQTLIMNWFKAHKAFSSGIVEGLNRKINLTTRKASGFRTYKALTIALFHTMGNLPEPSMTHSFC